MCISKWLLGTFGKNSEDQRTEELGEGNRQDWFQIVLSIKLSLGLCNLKITLSRVIVFNTEAWQKSMDLHCNDRKQKLKARKSTHPNHRRAGWDYPSVLLGFDMGLLPLHHPETLPPSFLTSSLEDIHSSHLLSLGGLLCL